MNENRFNLIDEPWIPIANKGKVSLRTVFSDFDLPNLGGNPVEKISLMKLLLSIAQASYTPQDNASWRKLGSSGMAKACLDYLERWHHAFYLYGENPFLQIPAVAKAAEVSYGAIKPEIAVGNTSVLTQINVEQKLDDAQKALLLLTQMAFSFGGKKTDNTCVLSSDYVGKMNDKGKPSTSPPGSALAFMGLLHNFYLGTTLQESIFYNILTGADIEKQKVFTQGLGSPPWENMPQGEDCDRAKKLKESLQGRLIPLSRFCLFKENSLHYTEGLRHLDYQSHMSDPSVAGNFTAKKVTMIWVNPDKRPWRFLTSLLSFLILTKQSVTCLQLQATLPRLKSIDRDSINIWSGGLSVSSNAGEQYVAGGNDYVESTVSIPMEFMDNNAYTIFEREMLALEEVSSIVYKSTARYYSKLNLDKNQAGRFASNATQTFWALAERKAQTLINACLEEETLFPLRKEFAHYAHKAFQSVCSFDTARQLETFVQAKPNLSKYLTT